MINEYMFTIVDELIITYLFKFLIIMGGLMSMNFANLRLESMYTEIQFTCSKSGAFSILGWQKYKYPNYATSCHIKAAHFDHMLYIDENH